MSHHTRNVCWSTDGTVIIDQVNLQVRKGSTVGLIGPNGSGKSSLLRLLAGLRRPTSGAVLIDGSDIAKLSPRELARRIAVVAQESTTEIDITVADVVALGRTPHRRPWATATAEDRTAIANALEVTGLCAMAHRRWDTLSGGERQRAHIARALTQQPSELLLDEPTNHLDIAHQLDLLDLVRELPLTSIIALHDLNHAAAFCDTVLVMMRGRVIVGGSPAEVLTEELVREVYGVESSVTRIHPEGRVHIRFLVARRTLDRRPATVDLGQR